jgi:hypothetical protein
MRRNALSRVLSVQNLTNARGRYDGVNEAR